MTQKRRETYRQVTRRRREKHTNDTTMTQTRQLHTNYAKKTRTYAKMTHTLRTNTQQITHNSKMTQQIRANDRTNMRKRREKDAQITQKIHRHENDIKDT